MLAWRTPYVARIYPNRVDVMSKVITYDSEGGRLETETAVQVAVPCSIQPANPQILLNLGLIGVEQARVVVFFHSSVYPGVAPNQEIRQTDGPQVRLIVVGVIDLGGLHTDYAVVCNFVGN